MYKNLEIIIGHVQSKKLKAYLKIVIKIKIFLYNIHSTQAVRLFKFRGSI